jgi:hypothetical protein
MGIKRVTAGYYAPVAVALNFSLIFIFIESASYNLNNEKIKLFLVKETSVQQEKQTREILERIPTNVLLVSDGKVLFKNNQSNVLVSETC